MGDCSVVHADRFVKANGAEIMDGKNPEMVGSSSAIAVDEKKVLEEEEEEGNEEVPLIGRAECRICQEEDSLDKLESPCACSGSLKARGNVGLDFLLFFVFFICALKFEALVLAFEFSSITS
uniref:Zinc finger protein, putative n=1 Tax=Solanum demissum TaxID=50514 RepID=Q0KIM1_SOLDE|nr:Zinc finger protein, putative [Solanum demissum]